MNKKIIGISVLILFFWNLVFGGVEIVTFTAKSQNGNVIIKWEVLNETNLKNYVIERKTVNGSFSEVASITPSGSSSYQYTDETAYKSSLSSIYVYRLKIVDNSGNVSYSKEITIYNTGVSGMKKTWGSIKALFK